jgi:tetratricopeptide (TPR) repeat protein
MTGMKKILRPNIVLVLLGLLILILAPRPLMGYLDLVQAHIRSTGHFNFLDTAPYYTSAAERIPWRPDLYEQAAFSFQAGEDYPTAEKYFRLALQHHALTPNGWLEWGRAVLAQGNVSRAVSIWDEALQQPDPDAWVHSDLADALQMLGNYNGAVREWQAFIRTNPDYDWAHYHLGLLLMSVSPGNALPELMLAAQLNPNLEKPIQTLRTALNTAFLSDDRAYQFLVSGQALAAIGKWDLAANAFSNALAENQDYPVAWAWLGQAKHQLGQEADAEFTKALSLDPESAMVQGLYGLYLQGLGKIPAALAAFQNAARIEPKNAGWQMALGGAFEQTGDLISAFSYYSSAASLAPGDPSTWKVLASFCINNDVDVASTGLVAAHKLIDLAPGDWQSYDLAGQAAFMTGEYPAAETYLNKAISLAPTQAPPVLHLALVYIQAGAPSMAYSYLILAKTFDPQGSYGIQAERLLEQYNP